MNEAEAWMLVAGFQLKENVVTRKDGAVFVFTAANEDDDPDFKRFHMTMTVRGDYRFGYVEPYIERDVLFLPVYGSYTMTAESYTFGIGFDDIESWTADGIQLFPPPPTPPSLSNRRDDRFRRFIALGSLDHSQWEAFANGYKVWKRIHDGSSFTVEFEQEGEDEPFHPRPCRISVVFHSVISVEVIVDCEWYGFRVCGTEVDLLPQEDGTSILRLIRTWENWPYPRSPELFDFRLLSDIPEPVDFRRDARWPTSGCSRCPASSSPSRSSSKPSSC